MLFTLTDDNKLLAEDYQADNIKIINLNNHSYKCLLLCSGNGLYYPNTNEEYTNKIRKQDRYEWEHIAKNKLIRRNFSKIIFIRDIYKQWYVTGINSKLNCIDKVVEYLKKETENFKVIVAGSSAGGYAAVLIGILLNAYRIINVSGQYNLWPIVNIYPLLDKYKNKAFKSKYYNLREILKNSHVLILYFFPIKCKDDIEQYNYIKDDKNILFFKIDSDQHGTGINGAQYPYFFICKDKKVKKIYKRYEDKIIDRNEFYYNANDFLIKKIKKLKKVLLVFFKNNL
ncbi:hypothetical protein TREPR_2379 [Treponema primitia ZAS-2]|uniref:Alpha/beta hydrolase n=1 Tax=Treponema primitia (strain ATCC BAA-887 / DSM 12427 / ZAS-2) TaxID=545694 RepID=F5YHK0_TREPZ|nr:hypothetical protein [Treponema primitia]AEF85538.1 hypothetical protein TREPR_2379 [Treponema primitia ZAS-2]